MNICVIFNPAARGEKARRFREQLASLSTQCALRPTYAPGTGRALAATAVREGFDLLVAAGGDGTVNEVLNGLGDEPDGFARVRLGVLPLGTINVFAKELNLPTSLMAAWEVIKKGRDTLIDLPEAEYTESGQTRRRFFAQMAGAGLDSSAIAMVDWEQKKKFGALAYVVAGLKAMHGPKPQIVATNGTETAGGELVLIGNGRFYGGKWQFFPKADLCDGLLEVSVFPRADWQALLRSGWALFSDRLYASGVAVHFQAESLHLYSTSSVPFHVEGENAGVLPVKFTVRRQALRVIVP